MYTDDAMIAILQRADEAFRALGRRVGPVPLPILNNDEYECCHIAIANKYLLPDNDGNLFMFTDAGRLELARLLKAREDKQRELERHGREKIKIKLDVTALVVSLFSIGFAACALWISALNRYWPLIRQQPVGIVRTVESLPNQTTTTQNSNQKTEPAESETDTSETSTNVQEN